MTDLSLLSRLADLASEKIRYCGGVTFDLTKSSISYCRDKIEREKILEFSCRLALFCQNMMTGVRSNTRLYLRPDHLDMVLQCVCEQIMQQKSAELKMKSLALVHRKCNSRFPVTRSLSVFNQATYYRKESFEDLLAAIIWHQFNKTTDVDYFSNYDPKLKSWNKRVNEKELLQKLGSPTSWDIFCEDQGEEENQGNYNQVIENMEQICMQESMQQVIEREKDFKSIESCVNHMQKVEDLKKRIMGAGDTYLTNDLAEIPQPMFNTGSIKQKKRTGVLSSIKKIFKTEKNPPTARPNNVHQEHGENSDLHQTLIGAKNMKNTNMTKAESDILKGVKGKDKCGQQCNNDKKSNASRQEIEDMDRNSLMIHIPNNVEKIVLVKDGHKIKIEI